MLMENHKLEERQAGTGSEDDAGMGLYKIAPRPAGHCACLAKRALANISFESRGNRAGIRFTPITLWPAPPSSVVVMVIIGYNDIDTS